MTLSSLRRRSDLNFLNMQTSSTASSSATRLQTAADRFVCCKLTRNVKMLYRCSGYIDHVLLTLLAG